MKYYKEIISENGNIAIDDTILVKDIPATAGSRILEGFKPLFSAEAVTRLEDKGYVLSGKTHVGEFGLDLAGEFSYGADQDEQIFGAAASLVKAGDVKAALGVDMNGSCRRAAALSGVEFLKPTYGTVSRYGIIPGAASGEQVGVYAQDADTIAEIMGVIAGHDDKDGTSLPDEKYEYHTDMDIAGKQIAVIYGTDKTDEDVRERVRAFAGKMEDRGIVITEIPADFLEAANTAWQILMAAEVCNNVSRYDGVKFGYRSENYRNIDELYMNTRTEGFNFLTKAVIFYGSDVLSKDRYKDCYDKSLRVRRVIADHLNEIFEKYDAVLMPVSNAVSYQKYDIKDAFGKVLEESIFTAPANLTGIPSLAGNGVQLIGKHFSESLLLSIMKKAEGEEI